MSPRDPIADFFARRRIAVVGATDRRDRWGYKIWRYLRDRGHEVFAVNPTVRTIEGARVFAKLEDIPRPAEGAPPVDAVDLVVNPTVGLEVARSCGALGIKSVWAQPGAESFEIAEVCRASGIDYIEDCVLVQGPGYPPPSA